VNIYFEHTNLSVYTTALLKYIALSYGHKISESPKNCDLIAISLNSFFQLSVLIDCKYKYNKPIIVGGHISHSPQPLLEYCDYINIGHGFEFFKLCRTIEDIKTQSFIYSNSKKKAIASKYVDWDLINSLPTHLSFNYLCWSFGCYRKCNFCLTSWMFPNEVNPNFTNLRDESFDLPIILSNYFSGITCHRCKCNSTIDQYLNDPGAFRNIVSVRIGIESLNLNTQRLFSKSISTDKIKQLILISENNNTNLDLCFIIGLEDSASLLESLLDILPSTKKEYPAIELHFIPFQPHRGTPLEDYPLNKFHEIINFRQFAETLKLKCNRVNIDMDNPPNVYRTILTTMMSRVTSQNVIVKLLHLYKNNYLNLNHFYETVYQSELSYLLESEFDSFIKFPYENFKEARKLHIKTMVPY
jgi:radical SAM superfamily enzyme YgiQ (UPF0313 family)